MFNFFLTLNEINAPEKQSIKENKWSTNSIFSIFKSKYFFLILHSRKKSIDKLLHDLFITRLLMQKIKRKYQYRPVSHREKKF